MGKKKEPAKEPEIEITPVEMPMVETPVVEEVAEVEVFSSESIVEEAAPPVEPGLDDFLDDGEPLPRHERRFIDFSGSKLPWLVDDFSGVTSSVYEAVMAAAHRARQVGRRQKQEIDSYNSAQILTPESIEEEETSEKGIDHFQHTKPTIEALAELKRKEFTYYYHNDKK